MVALIFSIFIYIRPIEPLVEMRDFKGLNKWKEYVEK